MLDSNLKEYIHKAVGVCGVSAGPFGGARMIQNLLPVLRELGLVMIFTDVYFGAAGKLFDPATGDIIDPAYARRLKAFIDELVWMARVLRWAGEPPGSLTSHEGYLPFAPDECFVGLGIHSRDERPFSARATAAESGLRSRRSRQIDPGEWAVQMLASTHRDAARRTRVEYIAMNRTGKSMGRRRYPASRRTSKNSWAIAAAFRGIEMTNGARDVRGST